MDTSPQLDFQTLRGSLYSAVLSDVMDSLGLPRQAMRPFIRPLDDHHVIFGPARTGLFVSRSGVLDGENPYDVEIELVDDLAPGDIPVFVCNGPTERLVPWGELLTTAAMQRGASGFLTDGLVRDVRAIREMGFPVFHGGIGPLDTKGRGKMVLRDVPVECAGVEIKPRDFIFGDIDGVVVIPHGRAQEIIDAALAKIHGENVTRREIANGALLGDVYRRYGVL